MVKVHLNNIIRVFLFVISILLFGFSVYLLLKESNEKSIAFLLLSIFIAITASSIEHVDYVYSKEEPDN